MFNLLLCLIKLALKSSSLCGLWLFLGMGYSVCFWPIAIVFSACHGSFFDFELSTLLVTIEIVFLFPIIWLNYSELLDKIE